MNVLVIQNSETSAIAYLGDYMRRTTGASTQVIRPEALSNGAALPHADVIVVLGSARGAYETLDWIERERVFVQDAIHRAVPVIGVCFGAQLIATAIGGASAAMGRAYFGWFENDVPQDSVWYGPWLRWHGDTISLPEGAEVLATSDGTIQAFQYKRAVGVQFHPEADETTLRNWIELASPKRRARLNVPGLIDESRMRFAAMAHKRDRLFGEIMTRVGI